MFVHLVTNSNSQAQKSKKVMTEIMTSPVLIGYGIYNIVTVLNALMSKTPNLGNVTTFITQIY